jgi:hypothetical protein
MKLAIIIGDGWADVPVNFVNNNQYREGLKSYLDFKMLEYDHLIINKSRGGSQNLYQLEQAQAYLHMFNLAKQKIEFVVWFHTELLRDWNRNYDSSQVEEMRSIGLDAYLDRLAEKTYQTARKLKYRYPSVKWIIVGGHCAIRDNKRYLLDWADLIIDNFRQELTGMDCPECHTYEFIDEFEKFRDCFPDDIIQRELTKKELIKKAVQNSDLFWNNAHGGPDAMNILADRIIKCLNLEKISNN